jgi:D-alanine-D-alanine ligase
LRVTILTYVESESSKDYDKVIPQVSAALRELGHSVSVLGIHDNVQRLVSGLSRRKPDLVFNLAEMFGDNVSADVALTGLLELLGIPYTGGGPGELYLQQDKVLTKKLLAFEKLPFPEYAIFTREADLEIAGTLRLPLFVKPLRADASIGINGKSLVRTTQEMMKQVLSIHEKCSDSALAEEYIEGREFYVGVVGNREPTAFPPIEIDFSALPDDKPRILDSKAKWDEDSKEYKGTRAVLAELPDELRAKLQKVSVDAYRALRVRDYGRIDLRLTETGDVYVIEANANCYLEQEGEFARAAAASGLDYTPLIGRILDEAAQRVQSPALRLHSAKDKGKTGGVRLAPGG